MLFVIYILWIVTASMRVHLESSGSWLSMFARDDWTGLVVQDALSAAASAIYLLVRT